MNHYPKHIGDWMTATAHLSEVEECIYSRMVDQYYAREAPLPLELAACCRLVRASTTAARKAVPVILQEFFEREPDGWHQTRCDEEIAFYRERAAKTSAFWKSIPPATRTAIEAARRAAKLNATPTWLSDEQRADITSIYEEARRLSESHFEPYEVDHIVPLRGVSVSGLHVPWNLRPIPARSNRAKGRSH